MTATPEPIGGSEAAAAAGIDPFCSRVELWARKTGRMVREPNEAMRWGNLLEPVIVAELRERGYDASAGRDLGEMPNRTMGGNVRDSERPWISGHPDGLVYGPGPLSLLEVKTAGRWQSWDDGVPVQYQAQVQHYLHLTGLDRALVACLVGGQRLEVQELDRDQEAIDALLDLEFEFWQYVVSDTPPPPDGSDSAKDALLSLYPNGTPGVAYRLTSDEWAGWKELLARREQLATVQAQVDELEQRFKLLLGEHDADTLISPLDTTVAHWRNAARNALDVARLKVEAPHVYKQYVKQSSTRRFTLA